MGNYISFPQQFRIIGRRPPHQRITIEACVDPGKYEDMQPYNVMLGCKKESPGSSRETMIACENPEQANAYGGPSGPCGLTSRSRSFH